MVSVRRAGDVQSADIELDAAARARFVVHSPWGRAQSQLSVPGMHMVSNAVAALAVAGVVGVDIRDAAAALVDVTVSGMRMEVSTAPGGATIVNDAYNANPTSMAAALDALAVMGAERRIAVLGLMAEIEDPGPAHRRDRRATPAASDRRTAGRRDRTLRDRAVDDVAAALGPLGPESVVLVKASRSAGLERIVAELLAR